jgi:hypothetical protein
MNHGSPRLSRLLSSIPRDPKNNARYGADFEPVSDFALLNSGEFRDHIATIEPFPVLAS